MENDFTTKRKVWWLVGEDGKDHVVIFNKPVIYERARFTFKRFQFPEAPLKEMFV